MVIIVCAFVCLNVILFMLLELRTGLEGHISLPGKITNIDLAINAFVV